MTLPPTRTTNASKVIDVPLINEKSLRWLFRRLGGFVLRNSIAAKIKPNNAKNTIDPNLKTANSNGGTGGKATPDAVHLRTEFSTAPKITPSRGEPIVWRANLVPSFTLNSIPRRTHQLFTQELQRSILKRTATRSLMIKADSFDPVHPVNVPLFSRRS